MLICNGKLMCFRNQRPALTIKTPEKAMVDVEINDLLNELFPLKVMLVQKVT